VKAARALVVGAGLVAALAVSPGPPAGALAEMATAVDELRALVKRDAESDARASIAAGNLKFLAVAGFTVHVPGVESDRIGCLAGAEQVDVIPGTADAPQGLEHRWLLEEATRYASRYNTVIAAHRGFTLPPACQAPRTDDTWKPARRRR